jgi:hypothetical protein
MKKVRVNGRVWKRFEAGKGDVDLSGLKGRVFVEARY